MVDELQQNNRSWGGLNHHPWLQESQFPVYGRGGQSRFCLLKILRYFGVQGHFWRPVLTLWCYESVSIERSCGAAPSWLLIGRDLTDWLRRPEMSWDAHSAEWRRLGESRMMAKLVKCKDLLLFVVIYDSKWRRTVGWTKEAIWRYHFGLWEIVTSISHYFFDIL